MNTNEKYRNDSDNSKMTAELHEICQPVSEAIRGMQVPDPDGLIALFTADKVHMIEPMVGGGHRFMHEQTEMLRGQHGVFAAFIGKHFPDSINKQVVAVCTDGAGAYECKVDFDFDNTKLVAAVADKIISDNISALVGSLSEIGIGALVGAMLGRMKRKVERSAPRHAGASQVGS